MPEVFTVKINAIQSVPYLKNFTVINCDITFQNCSFNDKTCLLKWLVKYLVLVICI